MRTPFSTARARALGRCRCKGGHQTGDLASRLVVDSLLALPAATDYVERLAQLRQYLHWLNRRLHQELTVTPQRRDATMGSTVVALLMQDNRLACVWTGDSRCNQRPLMAPPPRQRKNATNRQNHS